MGLMSYLKKQALNEGKIPACSSKDVLVDDVMGQLMPMPTGWLAATGWRSQVQGSVTAGKDGVAQCKEVAITRFCGTLCHYSLSMRIEVKLVHTRMTEMDMAEEMCHVLLVSLRVGKW